MEIWCVLSAYTHLNSNSHGSGLSGPCDPRLLRRKAQASRVALPRLARLAASSQHYGQYRSSSYCAFLMRGLLGGHGHRKWGQETSVFGGLLIRNREGHDSERGRRTFAIRSLLTGNPAGARGSEGITPGPVGEGQGNEEDSEPLHGSLSLTPHLRPPAGAAWVRAPHP